MGSTLTYDVLGRLAQIAVGGSTTQFHYVGDALVGEYELGALTKRYVHGDQVDEPLVLYTNGTVSPATRRYLHADHQGSLIAHSDTKPNLTQKNAYDPYGIPATTNDGRFGYTGQTWLKELGLNYYKARGYAPRLGRFLQTDPIFYEDDMNLYAYVGDDPMSNIDPTGKSCVPVTNDQGQVTSVSSCTIDIDRDKVVKKHGEAGTKKIESAYRDAVNKLLSKSKYASTTLSVPRVDGKGFAKATASAHAVAKNLIERNVGYKPTDPRPLSTHGDFKQPILVRASIRRGAFFNKDSTISTGRL